MKNRNLNHSDNYRTPDWFYNKLNEDFLFDFDPCPYNEEDIKPEEDGLLISWKLRNFINPPYSRSLKEAFVKKAIAESKLGKLCVMLLPVSTSTVLFHEHILSNAKEIRFVNKRIKFEQMNSEGKFTTTKNSGMHDSMIVIFDGRE